MATRARLCAPPVRMSSGLPGSPAQFPSLSLTSSTAGGPGRCYAFWEQFSDCLKNADTPLACKPAREVGRRGPRCATAWPESPQPPPPPISTPPCLLSTLALVGVEQCAGRSRKRPACCCRCASSCVLHVQSAQYGQSSSSWAASVCPELAMR